MNIETANRLYELRKKNGYSQEELAEKLGISRQAVSKWERAEASPDTDNLVELAKLYGISLDELLNINNSSSTENSEDKKEEKNENEKTINFDGGIHIEDGNDKVHIGADGINVVSEDGEKVHIGFDGIKFSNKEEKEFKKAHIKIKTKKDKVRHIVESILVPLTVFGSLIAYLLLGFTLGEIGWASYWVLFLLIPIVSSLINAIFNKRLSEFAYPILVVGVYCFLGIRFSSTTYTFLGIQYTGFWHPWWFLFLTIPVYYIIFGTIDAARKRNNDHVNVYINNEAIDEEDVD